MKSYTKERINKLKSFKKDKGTTFLLRWLITLSIVIEPVKSDTYIYVGNLCIIYFPRKEVQI